MRKSGGYVTFEVKMLTQKYKSKGGHTLCVEPLIAYGKSSWGIWFVASDLVQELRWGKLFWVADSPMLVGLE